jgi:hypothetical protein
MTKGKHMGSRTNFNFKSNGHDVVLYSHWGGDSKLTDLAYAIDKARPRWQDNNYAIRIAVSQLIGNQWESETGYGLSVDIGGEESYDTTTVDFDKQLVIHNGSPIPFELFLSYHLQMADR